MRVLTGMYKGRVLRTVSDLSVRPATGRVRQTIFDMLAHRSGFENLRVLDLFAGSGSLGIECLSRGAAHVTFVEADAEAVRYLEQNIATLGCEEKTEVLPMDAMAYVRGRHEPFDLVFADPPYRFPDMASLPEAIFGSNLVRPGGYVLIEHTTDIRYAGALMYALAAEKRFGRTVVTFLQINRHEPGTAES